METLKLNEGFFVMYLKSGEKLATKRGGQFIKINFSMMPGPDKTMNANYVVFGSDGRRKLEKQMEIGLVQLVDKLRTGEYIDKPYICKLVKTDRGFLNIEDVREPTQEELISLQDSSGDNQDNAFNDVSFESKQALSRDETEESDNDLPF